MSTLETRIEKLERKLREAQARKSSAVSLHEREEDEQSQNLVDNIITPTEDDPARQKKARQREKSDIDAIVSDFGFL